MTPVTMHGAAFARPRAATVRARIESPVGALELSAADGVLCELRFAADGQPADRGLVDDPGDPVLAAAIEQLAEYFAGDRQEFDLPLAPLGTSFQLQAWQALRTIPYGATISYGEQAHRMGDRRKARAVGGANGRNPISIIVPCHRVIGSDGSLTGFGGGLSVKTWLLDHERRTLANAD